MSHTPTVVVLHAHPDDEAIFTGATIHHLVDAGVRVVLVTATNGDEGIPRLPLRHGETLRSRRLAELERSCELLGVHRLELLGYRDSGAHGGPYLKGSLGAAGVGHVARRLERIVVRERASALFHYDGRGIYGHVDHVQVHRAGALVAARLGITGYEATVDAAQLRGAGSHVLRQAAGENLDAGVERWLISTSVQAGPAALRAKQAAMASHGSQIESEYLDGATFAACYGREWFVRRGAPGVLERWLGGVLVTDEREPQRELAGAGVGSGARIDAAPGGAR
jgi:LmbE family N-acetylglucosaminyl deacetylase